MIGIVVVLLSVLLVTMAVYAYLARREYDLFEEAAKNRMEDLVEVAKAKREHLRETVASLRRELKSERDLARDDHERLMVRVSELVRQNQNLAERVASLRQEGLSEGGDDFHVDEPQPTRPYSPELQTFYAGLEHPEAQMAAEQFIEDARAHGLEDEQILRELEVEWSG